ncbi:hypothetical protein E2C01_013870 [Portunus trituberculatus]|uniref:Ig-like domain-containing protein n=1 Tax=Portunus trituberculatus TaxID=210409 RepID=A0A5B7DIK1_PORTR|nr:hypothetical protein [Portunus trituberculatus]
METIGHGRKIVEKKREEKVITYDSERGGVSVVTEKGPRTTTNLLVRGAFPKDSGSYSCNPSSAPVAEVVVHILNDKSISRRPFSILDLYCLSDRDQVTGATGPGARRRSSRWRADRENIRLVREGLGGLRDDDHRTLADYKQISATPIPPCTSTQHDIVNTPRRCSMAGTPPLKCLRCCWGLPSPWLPHSIRSGSGQRHPHHTTRGILPLLTTAAKQGPLIASDRTANSGVVLRGFGFSLPRTPSSLNIYNRTLESPARVPVHGDETFYLLSRLKVWPPRDKCK